jgi:transcriptional antiterminator RfaH
MWYLIRTKYGNEETAQTNLERQGFETYKPLISLEKIARGKLQTVIEPAFRGYVFVSFDPQTQSAFSINNTQGVYGLVSFGGLLVSIPSREIESIKKTFEQYEHSDGYKQGENVRIIAGPFKGLDAIFSEPDGDKRSIIMLTLLNQNKSVIIENKFIAR